MKKKILLICISLSLLGATYSKPLGDYIFRAMFFRARDVNGIDIDGSTKTGTFTAGFGYRSLVPTALTSYKGILATLSDNLQYTRGSLLGGDGAGVVYENFNSNQGTLEFRVRPNWNGNDGLDHYIFHMKVDSNNYLQIRKSSGNFLTAEIKGAGTAKSVLYAVNATNFAAGTWYHIIATWEKGGTLTLYLNGSSVGTPATGVVVPTSVNSNFGIGQWMDTNANQFNGIIAGRMLNRPLSSTEVTALYASGAGHTDSFTVTPDVRWLGTYSDSDTDAIFWHRGQAVSATTATSATIAAAGLRSWTSGDRVVVWDGTGYKQETTLSATPASTATSLALTSVAAIANVGVGATLNGTTQYFSKTDTAPLSITGDMTIQAWIKTSSTATQAILAKWNNTDNKRSYILQTENTLQFIISNNGTIYESKTGTIAVNDGKWHFVAAVYDATAETVDFYVDGYLDRQQTFTTVTGALHDNDSELRIGVMGGTALYFYNGSIRNVQLFNDKRTAAEILTDATNPLADNTGNANQVSQWNLVDAAAVANPVDSNANANHLTLVGGTTTNYGTHSRTQTAFISKNLLQDGRMGNGGIGGWTVGGTTTLAKGTTTIKFDERVLRITNGAAAQSYSRQTLTTAAGEDYLFHGWFNSPATPNGASQLVDVDGTAALGVTVTQAGATTAATWYEVQSCFEAADTSTTIDLGSGSVTNAQIGRWDNVKVHKNWVSDGGMEDTLTNNWTQEANATMAADTDEHSGAQEMKITAGAANVGATQAITLVSGKYYTISGWARATAGDSGQIVMDKGDGTTLTVGTVTAATYAKISATFKSTGTAGNIYLRAVANTDIVWFDDVAIIHLDQDDPSTTGTVTPSTQANSWSTGKWSEKNGSVLVDGADTLTYVNTNNIKLEKGTIAFWSNIQAPYTSGDNKVFFDVRGADDNNRIKIYYQASSDKFVAYINGADRILSSAETGNTKFYTWIHIALSYNFTSDKYELFLNGASAGTDTTALTAPTFSTNNIYLGSNYDGSNGGDIWIDDFRIYPYNMSASQVKRLYYIKGQTIND